LRDIQAVRRALAFIFREAEADRMDPAKARVLVYTCQVLSQTIEDTEIEARLRELETSLGLPR